MGSEAEDAARAEAERMEADFIERMQSIGDDHARKLEELLKPHLPPGFHVVFDMEDT